MVVLKWVTLRVATRARRRCRCLILYRPCAVTRTTTFFTLVYSLHFTDNMIRSGARPDLKRNKIDHKKTQFAKANYKQNDYPHRLSLYDIPPTSEISLEQFETWAIDRLRGILSCLSTQDYANCLSTRRTRIMFFPEQIPTRDSRTS